MTVKNKNSLILTYVPLSATVREPWVHLEQIKPPDILQYASLQDVYRLWLMAATGISAQAIRPSGCPVEFIGSDVHVYLGFYVWPSDPDLTYTVSTAFGKLSGVSRIEKQRELSVLVNNAATYELPYWMRDVTVVWETPCFNRNGELLDKPPEVICQGSWIEFSSEVFGICRVRGVAVGESRVCEMVIGKEVYVDPELQPPAEPISSKIISMTYYHNGINGFYISAPPATNLNGYKTDDLQNTITTSWLDNEDKTQTEQLRLEIPQCVKDVLDFCPDTYKSTTIICQEIKDVRIYYNGCTGEYMYTDEAKSGQSFCSQIDRTGVPNGWLPEVSMLSSGWQ